MREVRKVVKEVEESIWYCDLCRSQEMPRCSENRVCDYCGREVCYKCHVGFGHGIWECACCAFVNLEFQPKINEAWKAHEQLKSDRAAASLTLKLSDIPTDALRAIMEHAEEISSKSSL